MFGCWVVRGAETKNIKRYDQVSSSFVDWDLFEFGMVTVFMQGRSGSQLGPAKNQMFQKKCNKYMLPNQSSPWLVLLLLADFAEAPESRPFCLP